MFEQVAVVVVSETHLVPIERTLFGWGSWKKIWWLLSKNRNGSANKNKCQDGGRMVESVDILSNYAMSDCKLTFSLTCAYQNSLTDYYIPTHLISPWPLVAGKKLEGKRMLATIRWQWEAINNCCRATSWCQLPNRFTSGYRFPPFQPWDSGIWLAGSGLVFSAELTFSSGNYG